MTHLRSLLLVTAIVATASGTALATSSSSSVSACVAKRGGALYVAKRCHRDDGRLTWSVAGPPGAQGKPGANGTNGTDGTNGTNGTSGIGPGYSTYHDANIPFVSEGTSNYTTILTLTVPAAGSYIVLATGMYIPPASPPGQTYCELRAGADFDHRTMQGFNPNEWTPLSFQVAHTFSLPGTAALVCSGNGTSGSAAGFIADTKLSAIQVSQLTSTPQ